LLAYTLGLQALVQRYDIGIWQGRKI
jgi:hypothetical protein